jgi:peroxiredoxin
MSILIFSCNAKKIDEPPFYYSLSVPIPKADNITELYVSYEIAGIRYIDSLAFNNKQINFYKVLYQPVAATIYTDNSSVQPLSVILANEELLLDVGERSIKTNKSQIQDDFLLLTENDRIRPNYFPLYGELSEKNDTVGLNKLGVVFDSLKNDDVKKSLDYFKANKNSLLSLYSFNRFTTFFADYSKIEKDFSLLPDWAKNSPDGKNILAIIEGAKSAQINTKAKGFTQQSSTGEKISLDAYQGKYILLDFWASWCAPCRKEHPNLIKTYERFKNKNFEIIAVSLDAEKDNWQNAIDKDKLTWIQISDLKGQQNEIAVEYGVQSVPANFLINPEGLIIAKNIKGEELNRMLNELSNK